MIVLDQVWQKMTHIRKCEEIALQSEIWWHDGTDHEADHNMKSPCSVNIHIFWFQLAEGGVIRWTFVLYYTALKKRGCLFGDVIITGCKGGCNFDNLWCSQWWGCCQGEDLSISLSPHQLHLIVTYIYISCHYYCSFFPCYHNFILCLFILCYLCQTIALVATAISWLYPALNEFYHILPLSSNDISYWPTWVRFVS